MKKVRGIQKQGGAQINSVYAVKVKKKVFDTVDSSKIVNEDIFDEEVRLLQKLGRVMVSSNASTLLKILNVLP
jgi:hypothetical protein